MKSDYEIVIIGAGVCGLATARALSEKGFHSILIIEKEENFGQGISSRNSEVIHSGIYYPKNTLKSKYCIQGRDLLYTYCAENDIFYNRCGKLIVANESQETSLLKLFELGLSKGLTELKILSRKEINQIEPKIKGSLGLKIESTGIINAHDLMNSFYQKSLSSNHDYLFKTKVLGCEITQNGYKIAIQSPAAEIENVSCDWVINSGGLNSDLISNMIIPKKKTPSFIFSKGTYFSLSSRWRNQFSHLIYPMPDKDHRSLGIHLSFDQIGNVKLGPDAHFLQERIENYTIDDSLINDFFQAASRYIVDLKIEDLSLNFSGIRPKINSKNHTFQDFYISHEIEKGFPGWINMIGIDSPGLTSSIAIGEDVAKMIQNV